MNIKLWGGVVAVMLILTCTGFYMSENTPDDETMVVVARVNTEGSGIFADSENYVSNDGGTLTFNKDEWDGKIFATPGVTSIQHMMLQDIVVNTMGMNFKLAPGDGKTVKDGTVYYTTSTSGVGAFLEMFEKKQINGGIVWEPHFSNILETNIDAYSVLKTSDLDPNHACCVIAANRDFALANGDSLIRFLTAYVETVTWMNLALSDKTSAEYDELFGYAESLLSGVSIVDDAITDSFSNVKYTYSLDGMKEDIISLVDTYSNIGALNNTIYDMGFNSKSAFADWLVNDTYLNNAVTKTAEDYANASKVTIRVAILMSDIHQLALEVGVKKGIFSKYNIEIALSLPLDQGGKVANALLTNQADIGLLGAPPVVLNTINMGR